MKNLKNKVLNFFRSLADLILFFLPIGIFFSFTHIKLSFPIIFVLIIIFFVFVLLIFMFSLKERRNISLDTSVIISKIGFFEIFFELILSILIMKFIFDSFSKIDFGEDNLDLRKVLAFSILKIVGYACLCIFNFFVVKSTGRIIDNSLSFFRDAQIAREFDIVRQLTDGKITGYEADNPKKNSLLRVNCLNSLYEIAWGIKFKMLIQCFMFLIFLIAGIILAINDLHINFLNSINVITNISVLYGFFFSVISMLFTFSCSIYLNNFLRDEFLSERRNF